MRGTSLCLRILRTTTVLGLAAAIIPIHLQAASDPEQRLRDQYKGKVFVLRGFNQGARLTYDSAGSLVHGPANPGDWTVDGFVRITALDLSDRRLTIKAERLYLGVAGGMGFLLTQLDSNQKGKDAKRLRIDVAVDPAGGAVEAALSKVFLTSEDHFAELVPDPWKPCALAASTGKSLENLHAKTLENLHDCHFAPEFTSIPGVVYRPEESSGREKPVSDATGVYGEVVPGSDASVTRAKVVHQLNPEFSEAARSTKYQGTTTLAIIVDKTGQARSIRITRPIGMGLDQKAVEAVSKWQFEPARRDGEPIAMGPILIEVDFHLW